MTTILMLHTDLVKRLEIKYESCHSIYIDEDVPFCINTNQCDCADSSICDPHHQHIITGDLQIIKT